MTRNLVILGSTGSIGRQTLEVAAAHPDRLRVVGLAASKSASLLSLQAAEFHPAAVALSDEAGGKDLEVPAGTDTFVGQRAVVDLLERTRPDLAVLAVVGGAALEPLLWLLANKVQVALANKETLVMAGEIIRRSGGAPGELIRPVDSEHSALWQCLMGVPREQLAYIWLTASGGPFRTWNKSLLGNVSPAQVLAHPTWKMGPRVTVDSATLMNKGFEVIEARWLYDIEEPRIRVIVQPSSVVHSLIELVDGSMLAQMAVPDMRIPIQYALSYPERWPSPALRLQLPERPVIFEDPRLADFPALELAREALRRGGVVPACLNAADEVAVQSFLAGQISFTNIVEIVESVTSAAPSVISPVLDDILSADKWAREAARSACEVKHRRQNA